MPCFCRLNPLKISPKTCGPVCCCPICYGARRPFGTLSVLCPRARPCKPRRILPPIGRTTGRWSAAPNQIWTPDLWIFPPTFCPGLCGTKNQLRPQPAQRHCCRICRYRLKRSAGGLYRSVCAGAGSVAVIEQLTGRTPKVVLDSTLLPATQDFAPILGTASQGDYLFFYSIDYPPEVCRTVQQTARRLHLPVYILFTGNKTYRALPYGFRLARRQTPGDFLALVKGQTGAKHLFSRHRVCPAL